MFDRSPPPPGSIIESNDDRRELRLHWRRATMHPARKVYIAIVALFLFSFLMFIPMIFLMPKPANDPGMPMEMTAFVIVMQAVTAAVLLAPLVIPRACESLILSDESLSHDTGSPPLPWPVMAFLAPMISPVGTFLGSDATPIPWRRRQRTLPRETVSNIRLERVGERQRLTFDYGADRIEIGADLREPEREWLADELQRWQSS